MLNTVAKYMPVVANYMPIVANYLPIMVNYIPAVANYIPTLANNSPTMANYIPNVANYLPHLETVPDLCLDCQTCCLSYGRQDLVLTGNVSHKLCLTLRSSSSAEMKHK